jgi:nitroreductase
MDVSRAVATRRSVRAFVSKPVPAETVREILAAAARAPSSSNLQPWRVYAAAGPVRDALVERVRERIAAGVWSEGAEVPAYPAQLHERYRARRRKLGADLYATLGVAPDDKLGKLAQVARNFELFGAPVGLFFAIDRELGPPQWADLGMFAQTVMLLARERGLASCPQQSWAEWPQTLREVLGMAPEETVAFGMSLGFEDESARIGGLRTGRAGLDQFASLRGFE